MHVKQNEIKNANSETEERVILTDDVIQLEQCTQNVLLIW